MKYYEILGVNIKAKPEEIKKAYKKLSMKYHPDKNSGQDDKFKEINEAYSILIDPEKRKYYDNYGISKGGEKDQLKQILKTAFETVINNSDFEETDDIINILKANFEIRIDEGQGSIKNIENKIKFFKSIKARFKGKKETVILFKEKLDDNIKSLLTEIKSIRQIIKYIKILLKMINGVKYDTNEKAHNYDLMIEDLKSNLGGIHG
jgi:curved DNA-binding protein CbpA